MHNDMMQSTDDRWPGYDGPRRTVLRLRGFDYASPGAYFVTICTADRGPVLGCILDGVCQPTDRGLIVSEVWRASVARRPNARSESFALMPNHVHALVYLLDIEREVARPSLSDIVREFKSRSTVEVNRRIASPRCSLWQRGFYERVIRESQPLDRVRAYIENNATQWSEDQENPLRTPALPGT